MRHLRDNSAPPWMFIPCSPEFFSWKSGALSEETVFMAGHAPIANVACFFHSDAAEIFRPGHFVRIWDSMSISFFRMLTGEKPLATSSNHNFEPDVTMDSPITFGVTWAHLSARFSPDTVLSKRTMFLLIIFFWDFERHMSSLSVSLEIQWSPDAIGIGSLIHFDTWKSH